MKFSNIRFGFWLLVLVLGVLTSMIIDLISSSKR
jgi:hypothetical protein